LEVKTLHSLYKVDSQFKLALETYPETGNVVASLRDARLDATPENQQQLQRLAAEAYQNSLRTFKIDPTAILKKMLEFSETSALDFYEQDRSGDLVLKDIAELPRTASSVRISRTKYGEQMVSIKVPDQLRAIELLGKHLGLYVPDSITNIQINAVSDEERVGRLQFMLQGSGHAGSVPLPGPSASQPDVTRGNAGLSTKHAKKTYIDTETGLDKEYEEEEE